MTRRRTRNKKRVPKQPEETKIDSNQSDLSLKDQGNKLFASGNYNGAVEIFTQALEEDSKNHLILSNRAATYFQLKEFKLGLADAEQCIKVAPEWAKGYFRQGQALEGLYQYPEAFDAYKAGLELSKDDANLNKAFENMKSMLEELKITQSQMEEKKNNPDNDKFERMCKWLRDGGGKFPKLYLQYYGEDYRGVHAICKIPSNEVILYVPESHIMTNELAKASEIGKKMVNSSYQVTSTDSYLAGFLLQEKHKGEKSFWKPYIDILPQVYANMPIYFGEELLSELVGSFSLEMRANRIESLKREYEGICKAVPEFKQFTHDEFVWGRLVVITRQFGITVNKVETDGLVPYADMLNHLIPRQSEWTYTEKIKGFTITTLKGLNPGDQIYDSYGHKCNSRFFVNYGFSVDTNHEDNEAVIRLQLPASDPQYKLKYRLLGNNPYGIRKRFQMPADYSHKKTKGLFSFLRFIHAQGSEFLYLTELADRGGDELKVVDPLSIANETAVLKQLKIEALANMARFKTTIEEDEKLADTKPMYSNIRNCIIMRLGEKRVLRYFAELADHAIPLLQLPWKDLKRHANKLRQAKSPFESYVTGAVIPLVRSRK